MSVEMSGGEDHLLVPQRVWLIRSLLTHESMVKSERKR